MDKVSIQEASRRLNVSQDVIRGYIRSGRLKAAREGEVSGRKWLVELPDEGWVDDFKERIEQLDRGMTRWWWTSPRKEGRVHYVESLGIEEITALFLCRDTSEDIWPATGHTDDERCPECLRAALEQGLPLDPAQ